MLIAYQTLLDTLLELGELEEAQDTLQQATAIAQSLQDPLAQFQVDAPPTELKWAMSSALMG